MADLKNRKYSKEQMVSYLEKHGSTMTEAANICGTSPRTLGRYLSEGIIPSEWYTKITTALKDRKPAPKAIKAEIQSCAACGKKLTMAIGNDSKSFNVDADVLADIGVKAIPASGWHWFTNTRTGVKTKMYPVCEKCWLRSAPKVRKNTLHGKVTTKSK